MRELALLSIEKLTELELPPTIFISRSFSVIREASSMETASFYELIFIVSYESRDALTILIVAIMLTVSFSFDE